MVSCYYNDTKNNATHTTPAGWKVREDITGNLYLEISIVVLSAIIGFSLKKRFLPGGMWLEKALTMLRWNFGEHSVP